MTVRELINELEKYPDDMDVEIYASYDAGWSCAGGKIQYIEKNLDYSISLCNDEG